MRYFIEVSYKGTSYAGSQVQANAVTVQSSSEKAFEIFFRQQVMLTGSSRTDTGVHAFQNYYHFDIDKTISPQAIYNLNAIIAGDIAIKNIVPVAPSAHSRFDATAREYEYYLYQEKNPFLADRAYYFPYPLDINKLQAAAALLLSYTDFTSFAKRNAQVKTFNCQVLHSEWTIKEDCLVYRVKANRFLRGMVKGLVGTMIKVGLGKTTLEEFAGIIEQKDCTLADFSVPGHGLFLVRVYYPDGYFRQRPD
jgi:tRNA pseudouridine38-40 synthase